ncbi:MAG: diguanylate cyclase [Betaproteobacteria bacterium]|nr:diguanylate cyclase [Betaproteobacteria bacterium]
MASPSSPAEIAGKTLKTLVARKLAPTPENYARIYAEVSGKPQDAPVAEQPQEAAAPTRPALAWSALIRDLLRQLEAHHKGITLSRKKDGLDVVLTKFSGNPEALYEKLHSLLRSWGSAGAPATAAQTPAEATGEAREPELGNVAQAAATAAAQPAPVAAASAAGAQPPAPAAAPADQEMMGNLKELLAQSLESGQSLQQDLGQEIRELAQQVRTVGDQGKLMELAKKLRHFWVKLELRGGDKAKIQEGLLRLLRLLVENVGELVADDKWLHGQIAVLQDIIAQPLDKRSITEAERNLRDALIKQSTLKKSLADAKATLKSLMTTFIDRMGELTESTGEYHAKMEAYNLKIGQADNLTELSHILEDIMQDTRVIQASALRSHEELVEARRQADDAEHRIRRLEEELEQVSELVRADQLTGTLNRRGLDEMLERETARADRSKDSLSVVLLDIDNFKLLNDTMGHQAGDQALMHVSDVIRESLRPSDSVARYGGEEFLVVLPGSGINEAAEIIGRLQRLLTKKLFVYNGEPLLITFSAGVAARLPGEVVEEAIERADQAMYKAKAAGKNRVVKAE